jgi:hypothetical protein
VGLPLDWGFALELDPIISVEELTWTNLKRLYRSP